MMNLIWFTRGYNSFLLWSLKIKKFEYSNNKTKIYFYNSVFHLSASKKNIKYIHAILITIFLSIFKNI